MKNTQEIENIVKAIRPKAKFVKAAYLDAVSSDNISIRDYYLVSLYDAKIDSVFNKCKYGYFIINNSYLSSFAYNLYLGIILHHKKDPIQERNLILHNFKKFYAEQLYYFNNCIFSRAILIETLLEERNMREAFDYIKTDSNLSQTAKSVASIMNSLISSHELGHHIFNHESGYSVFIHELPDEYKLYISRIQSTYPEAFFEEIICDLFSVHSNIEDINDTVLLKDRLNTIIWGYASFAIMFSLVKSAKATSNEIADKYDDNINFDSIKKFHRDYPYTIGVDLDFKERPHIVIEYCKLIASTFSIELNNDVNDLIHPDNILEYLYSIMEDIMLTNDNSVRSVSMLLSESLHNHSEGSDYLFLRSKTFESERDLE